MAVGAAGAIGVGMIGGAVAGERAARAQGAASAAQLAEERARREQVMKLAEPSPEEMAQLQQSITLNTQDIARKQKLIDSSDPALIEAGQQALKLLRGEEASNLSPLKNQFAREEEKLRNKLRAQLGSGYENTTAGSQALAQFQQAKGDSFANAQQQSLGQLLGVAANTSGNYGMQSNFNNAMAASTKYGSFGERAINAINGSPINPGLAYAGDIAEGANQKQTFGQITQLGGLLAAGSGLFGPQNPGTIPGGGAIKPVPF